MIPSARMSITTEKSYMSMEFGKAYSVTRDMGQKSPYLLDVPATLFEIYLLLPTHE